MAGALIVAIFTSLTATICFARVGLPLLSVTVQVTVVSPLGNLSGASLETLATAQLSPVTALPRSTPVEYFSTRRSSDLLRLAGAVMVGFSWSLTVTICVAVSELPLLSVTVQVTVVLIVREWCGAWVEILVIALLLPFTARPRFMLVT